MAGEGARPKRSLLLAAKRWFSLCVLEGGRLCSSARVAPPGRRPWGRFAAGAFVSLLGLASWPGAALPAAAPEKSQLFMLVGVAITLPLILAYTAWAYWVFRGKVGNEGYH